MAPSASIIFASEREFGRLRVGYSGVGGWMSESYKAITEVEQYYLGWSTFMIGNPSFLNTGESARRIGCQPVLAIRGRHVSSSHAGCHAIV